MKLNEMQQNHNWMEVVWHWNTSPQLMFQCLNDCSVKVKCKPFMDIDTYCSLCKCTCLQTCQLTGFWHLDTFIFVLHGEARSLSLLIISLLVSIYLWTDMLCMKWLHSTHIQCFYHVVKLAYVKPACYLKLSRCGTFALCFNSLLPDLLANY